MGGQGGSDSSAGGASNYMKQYAGDYSKYMNQGSSDDASPVATLMVQKDAKSVVGTKDATEDNSAGAYGKYMKEYSGDYSRYMSQGGSSSSAGSYDKYMK